MRVAFVSSEVVPFASTGGLGDVASALPRALANAGSEVYRIMPFYSRVWDHAADVDDTGLRFEIPLGTDIVRADIWVTRQDGVTTYLVRRDELFDRRELYGLPDRDYDDNLARFVLFQKAAVALIDALEGLTDIVHCNDWQTGLLPLYLQHGIYGLKRECKEKTVFTIHNLAYQGQFSGTQYYLSNLPMSLFGIDGLEFYGSLNCLKGGLVGSDIVTTVSETYAQEIRGPSHGAGLEGVLSALGPKLVGILNGVDYGVWNPESDPHTAASYGPGNIQGKMVCRRALLKEVGLKPRARTPLFGMVSRLTGQKGLDVLEAAMPVMMERGLQFVLLGSGEARYQELCTQWAARWPEQFAAHIGFDPGLAHRIEAGSDLFMMPSRFEPCGLNQLYSLKYGTIPLVHATGGLADTVVDVTNYPNEGTGFSFDEYTVAGLLEAVERAEGLYKRKAQWGKVVERAMAQDFSWTKSAARYLALYESLLAD